MKAVVPVWSSQSLNRSLFDDFDHFFGDFFQPQKVEGFSPALSVQETDKHILLSFDIPGVGEKDIEVHIESGKLSVSGERKSESKENSKLYAFSERRFGKFKRSFDLPESVETENVEADYTHGVLKILLPKKEKEQPKKLDVKLNSGGLFSNFSIGKEEK